MYNALTMGGLLRQISIVDLQVEQYECHTCTSISVIIYYFTYSLCLQIVGLLRLVNPTYFYFYILTNSIGWLDVV